MDRLFSLLPHFGFQTSVFFQGEFCGQNHFPASQGMGHMHLVRDGSVVLVHPGGVPLEIREPALVFYPRPHDHRLLVPPGSPASLLCANVMFRQKERNPIALALPAIMQVPLNGASGLLPVLALLFEEAARKEPGNQLVLDHLCDILVVHLVRHALKENLIRAGVLAGLSDAQLAPVIAALHAQPARSWTIEEMASVAHISRTTFANRFREVVGVPPAEYLAAWRMELAKSLLLEGKTVKAVAQAVGYRTQPAFTHAFISRCGVAPSAWLAQVSAPPQCG